MEEKKTLTTLEEVKGISDPFKYRILMGFYKMEKPATIKQIADSLNEVPAKVYYHVKKMESLGILKLIYTKEIRGIVAKYYEPTAAFYDIQCSEEAANSNRKLILAESQKLLGELYDTSKNSFFEELVKCAEHKDKTNGNLNMTELYLSDDESEEFSKYIKNFFKKYENKDRKADNLNKYHCFVSFFKINKD